MSSQIEYLMLNGLPAEKTADVNDDRREARSETATQPTPAQIEAGNYAKGKFNIHGFTVAIENPKGSVRAGTDKSGRKWSTTMTADYGYILGSKGKDKDHLDIFVGEDLAADAFFIINQNDPSTGAFDEHKIVYGVKDAEKAKALYLSNYEEDWKGLGSLKEMSVDEFKSWLLEGDHEKKLRSFWTRCCQFVFRLKRPDPAVAGYGESVLSKAFRTMQQAKIAEDSLLKARIQFGSPVSAEELAKRFHVTDLDTAMSPMLRDELRAATLEREGFRFALPDQLAFMDVHIEPRDLQALQRIDQAVRAGRGWQQDLRQLLSRSTLREYDIQLLWLLLLIAGDAMRDLRQELQTPTPTLGPYTHGIADSIRSMRTYNAINGDPETYAAFIRAAEEAVGKNNPCVELPQPPVPPAPPAKKLPSRRKITIDKKDSSAGGKTTS